MRIRDIQRNDKSTCTTRMSSRRVNTTQIWGYQKEEAPEKEKLDPTVKDSDVCAV